MTIAQIIATRAVRREAEKGSTLATIVARRVRLNRAKRQELNMNASRPMPCYPAPIAWLTNRA